jgi:hypothetical protein
MIKVAVGADAKFTANTVPCALPESGNNIRLSLYIYEKKS